MLNPTPLINVSAGTSSAFLSALTFSNSNSVSFGLNGSTLTGSFSQYNQAVSAANGSYTFQTLSFIDGNGISFATSFGSDDAGIYASYTVPAQFSGGFSTAGNTAGTTGLATGRLVLAGGSNITLSGSTDAGSMTVTIIGAAGGGGSVNLSAGTTSGNLASVTFADSNGVSFGLNAGTVTATVRTDYQSAGAYLTTAMLSNAATISNVNLSAGTTSNNLSAMVFSNSNGVSFGLNGSTVTASVNAGGAFSGGMSTNGNTTGTTGLASDRLILVGGNNITLSGSTNAGSMTISIEGATVAPSPVNFSVGNTSAGNSANLGSVVFEDSNGVSFGLLGSTITASVNAGVFINAGTHGESGNSFTFQDTNGVSFGITGGTITASVEPYIFSNSNNMTFGTYSGSDGTYVTGSFSVTGGGGAVNFSAGTTSNDLSAVTFSNSNGFSFGLNGSTMTASADASSLVAGPGISISTTGSTISLINIGLTASEFEPYPANVGGANTGVTAVLMPGSTTSGPVRFFPFYLPYHLHAGYLNMIVSQSFSTLGNSSGRQTGMFKYGLYSRLTGTDSTILSQITSHSFGWSVTGNNSTYSISQPNATDSAGFTYTQTSSAGSNITSGYTGQKLLVLPINQTMTPGNYWLAVQQTQSKSSIIVGVSQSLFGFNVGSTAMNLAPMGSFTTAYSSGTNQYNRSGGAWYQAMGSFTVAGLTSLPDTVGMNSITANVNTMPYFSFWSS